MRMRLVIAALLLMGGTLGVSVPGCPERGVSPGVTRGVNKLHSHTPRFGLNSEIYDTYSPGQTYELELGQSDVAEEVEYLHLLSEAVEESEGCGALGSWHQVSPSGPQPREGCDHVLQYTEGGAVGKFQWTAPSCGCVTISAVVVSGGEYFADDKDALQGPLTMTLCPEDAVPSLFDDEFYGEEEEEKEEALAVLEEVNDIITDTASLMPQEEDDDEEDGEEDGEAEEDEEEEEEEGTGHRAGRRRGGKGKKGHGRRGKGRHDHAPEGRRRGKGRGRARNMQEEKPKGKFWKKKMGRKAKMCKKCAGVKAARLQKLCTKMEKKSTARVGDKSELTSQALELRGARWATYRDDMLQCCEGGAGGGEELVECFREAHGRRITEKVCAAEEEHFQAGAIPPKIQAAQEKCCETQGEEKAACLMDAHKVMRRLRRQHKRAKASNSTGVEAICRRVKNHPLPPRRRLAKLPIVQRNRWTAIFTERRLKMAQCCDLAAGEEQEACVEDVREERFDRVCAGEEDMSPPWSKSDTQPITEECCALEGEERYGCFSERVGRGGRGGRGAGRRAGSGDDETPRHRHGKKMNRRARVSQRREKRRGMRACCHGGREAALGLPEAAPKWRTCHAEAQGYILDRDDLTTPQLCVISFRKCCVHSVVRNAREEAVEEAEEEVEEEVEEEEEV